MSGEGKKISVPILEGTELHQYETWIRKLATYAKTCEPLIPVSRSIDAIADRVELPVAVIPPARPANMVPDSEEEYQYLVDREDRRTVASKRRAHVLHPFLLAAIEYVGLIMYQHRQELSTPTRTPSIQDIRDNELGIHLLQFVRDCCILDSKRNSDALAIKDLRVSAWNALQKVSQRSNILIAAHLANFVMRLRTLEQYEGLKPEHYPYSLLQDTWISSVNASFYSEYLLKTFLEEETKIVFPNIYALLEHAKTQGLTQEYFS
jgi:hypothetical protein